MTKTLIGPLGRVVALWLVLPVLFGAAGCRPTGTNQVQLEALGEDVLLSDGLAFVLPAGFRAVPSTQGQVFLGRASAKAAYDTITVQRREEGHPALLDGALETLLGQLEPLEQFDLLDVQLSHVGPYLALSYAVEFEHLEAPRRQWGALIGTDTGILAIVMTSPKESFHEATDDYLSLLGSLHVAYGATAQPGP